MTVDISSIDLGNDIRYLPVKGDFSLAETCGPVAWGRGRWPGSDWIDGAFVWVGREDDELASRIVRQVTPDQLSIAGSR
jgi:hypothetical protein